MCVDQIGGILLPGNKVQLAPSLPCGKSNLVKEKA